MNNLHKIKIRNAISACAISFMMAGCAHPTGWSEKQRADFKIKCSQIDTVRALTFTLTGFRYGDIDTVMIKAYKGDTLLDSFPVSVEDRRKFDADTLHFFGTIPRTVYLDRTYRFLIPGEPPYLLSDMHMVMWPTFAGNVSAPFWANPWSYLTGLLWPTSGENYSCEMGDFTLDNVKYAQQPGPELKKRELKAGL